METNEHSAIVEMSCVEVRALSVGYLEGEIGLGTYIRVDAHLEHCAYCSAVYDGIRNVIALLGSEELFPVPNRLEERLYNVLLE